MIFAQSNKNMYHINSAQFKGFNVETVEYKNISFTVWDVGGQVDFEKL